MRSVALSLTVPSQLSVKVPLLRGVQVGVGVGVGVGVAKAGDARQSSSRIPQC
jgi:hypothetical protein